MRTILIPLLLAALVAPAIAQDDWQTRKNRENAATSASSITNNGGRWDSKAEAERKAAAQQRAAGQHPTSFTHCDAGFCYGNNGRAYSRSGPDVLVSPEGRICNRSGPTWNCQ